jgi:hypothetical protein
LSPTTFAVLTTFSERFFKKLIFHPPFIWEFIFLLIR